MDTLKPIFASNLIRLRTKAGMTQAELGAILNYSDKTVSKWERADALPDAAVLKQLSERFGVTVDYLLSTHDTWTDARNKPRSKADLSQYSTLAITLVVLAGIWTMAVFIFVVLWMIGTMQWLIFVCAVPVSLVALLVFNTLWGKREANLYIVMALVLSVFALAYLAAGDYKPWQLFLVVIPSEVVVYLSFRIRKKS